VEARARGIVGLSLGAHWISAMPPPLLHARAPVQVDGLKIGQVLLHRLRHVALYTSGLLVMMALISGRHMASESRNQSAMISVVGRRIGAPGMAPREWIAKPRLPFAEAPRCAFRIQLRVV
jgi:hypothetical protein